MPQIALRNAVNWLAVALHLILHPAQRGNAFASKVGAVFAIPCRRACMKAPS
jgi:hypothetical protein